MSLFVVLIQGESISDNVMTTLGYNTGHRSISRSKLSDNVIAGKCRPTREVRYH